MEECEDEIAALKRKLVDLQVYRLSRSIRFYPCILVYLVIYDSR